MRSSPAAVPRNRVRAGLVAGTLILAACSPSTEPRDVLRLEALTETTLAGTVGQEVTPVPIVRATTRDGTPAADINIHFEVSHGGSVQVGVRRTDTDGKASAGAWTLGTAAGAQTLTARAAGADVVFTAMAAAEPAAQITPVAGNYQMGLTGATLAARLRAKVTDRFGNAVSGAEVAFEVVSGDGTLEGGIAVTDLLGVATSGTWTLGPAVGPQQVGASANGAHTIFTALACDNACPQLAFARDGQIYTLVNGAEKPLTAGRGNWGSPAWSPDGQRIAFVSYEDWHGTIYLMNVDGSAAESLAAGYDSPAWSPDGQLLAVDTGVCIYYCEIYLLSVGGYGTAPRPIAAQAKDPAWSPDGARIAFVSLSGDDGYHALHLMKPDGSDVMTVTPRDEGAIYHPTWSPDGRRIAFAKCLEGCDIYAVNPDGSNLVRLTTLNAAFDPAWSPDGALIAFTFEPWNSSSVAYIAADGGGEPVVLTSGHSPAWRP